jgi:hypothetical protein
MAPKQLEGLPRTSTENIKAWFSSEFNNAEKLQAHLVSDFDRAERMVPPCAVAGLECVHCRVHCMCSIHVDVHMCSCMPGCCHGLL